MEIFYIMAMVFGGVLSMVLGPFIIPQLIKLKIGQSIREDGPKKHLAKSGTPTMGGLIFILSCLISVLALGVEDRKVYICLMSMLGFGLIGLLDDYLIVVKKDNQGLSAKQKFSLQIIMALILILVNKSDPGVREFIVPFMSARTIDLGFFYYPICLFIILGTVNSVNLTDGLDGLATSVSIIGLVSFSIIINALNGGEVTVFVMGLAGALSGFLFFNKFPAKVFMGDVGSLALGGAFAAIGLETSTLLFLPIVGFIFVVETLSVIIQVISFKTRGKRVFRMSPLHHHFEEIGYHETKVVKFFALISLLFGAIAIIGIF